MFFHSAGWVKQGAPLPAHLLYKMSEGKKSRDENCWDPSWPKLLQDIYQKKSELLCPECRKPVEVAIDSLPPNILANRILEVIKLKSCWVQIFIPHKKKHLHQIFPGNDSKAKQSLQSRSSFSRTAITRAAQGSSPSVASAPPTKEAGHKTGRHPKTSSYCARRWPKCTYHGA